MMTEKVRASIVRREGSALKQEHGPSRKHARLCFRGLTFRSISRSFPRPETHSQSVDRLCVLAGSPKRRESFFSQCKPKSMTFIPFYMRRGWCC
eukprot:4073826-Amphidinium_carterae.1